MLDPNVNLPDDMAPRRFLLDRQMDRLRVAIWFAAEKPREQIIADALARGIRASGDLAELRPTDDWTGRPGAEDVGVLFSVKGKALWDAYGSCQRVMIDKGYRRIRDTSRPGLDLYYRMTVGEFQPLARLARTPTDSVRFDRWDVRVQEQPMGDAVMLAGSSGKYHRFHDLPHPTEYAAAQVRRLRELGYSGNIVYRPKPSWLGAIPIDGTEFSNGKEKALTAIGRCRTVVSHGSNITLSAAMAGIPVVVSGPGAARPVASSWSVDDAARPLPRPDASAVEDLCRRLAWWQWTLPEMASGEAWAFLRPEVLHGYERSL